MISFFPDLNVWLALSAAGHLHSAQAWQWLDMLSPQARLIFSRYTQVGLLRLPTNTSVMGEQTLTLQRALLDFAAKYGKPAGPAGPAVLPG